MNSSADLSRSMAHSGQVVVHARSGRSARPYGDARRQHVVDTCVLCGKQTNLMLGHVIPKWASPKGMQHGTVDGGTAYFSSQESARYYLACQNCEQLMGQGENYLRLLANGDSNELLAHGITVADGHVMRGVSAETVKRALLGVLLKGHYARANLWQSFHLSSDQLTRVRQYILGQNPRMIEPTVVAFKWMAYSRSTAQREWQFVIPTGTPRRSTGATILFGGVSWVIVLGRLARDLVSEGYPTLQMDGTWEWMVADACQCMTVDSAILAVHELTGINWQAVDGSAVSCPCGSGKPFACCCQGFWYPNTSQGYLSDESLIAGGLKVLDDAKAGRNSHWTALCRTARPVQLVRNGQVP